MKRYYYIEYIKGTSEKLINELIFNFEYKKHNSQIKIDSLDLCQIFGYIKHLENIIMGVEMKKSKKKIPEKLNKQHFHKRQRQLTNKINEIIDYLKSKGE